MKQNQRRYS